MTLAVCFRMDDVSPVMNRIRFRKFIDLFKYYQVKPLLGIIPDNKIKSLWISKPDNNFWNQIRELKKEGFSIAQHGYQHTIESVQGGILGLNLKSEFSGLSFDKQYERASLGQKILKQESLQTNIWMPPFHSYDLTTLKVIREIGFDYVSDGQSIGPYEMMGLKFIPCQMESPRCWVPFSLITVCIHSDRMSDSYIEDLENFIRNNRKLCVDFSEAIYVRSSSKLSAFLSEQAILLLRHLKQFLPIK